MSSPAPKASSSSAPRRPRARQLRNSRLTARYRQSGQASKFIGPLPEDTLDSSGPMSFAPASMTRVQRGRAASVVSMRNGDMLVTHREYFADVVASSGSPSTFKNDSYAINPGQVTMFPWLSKIAANFESFRFVKLAFQYETDAPSSLGGTVVLAVDYDASDAPATSKQQAQAYRSFVKSAPWKECTMTSLSADLHKLKSHYIRPGAQPANTDIKTYDIGNLNVITQSVSTASALCGELYVDYTVQLLTPVYENLATPLVGGSAIAGGGDESDANPFGSTPTLVAGSVGISIDAASNLSFKYPGTYLLNIWTTATAGTIVATPGAGVTVSATASVVASATNVSSTYSVVVTLANAAIAITGTGSVTNAELLVGSAPAGSL